ncbi:MAG TPA: MFS transporter [Bryobacteraceae bacterium]|nr:MFS transporter [Bryobacteraceae bacterium]
MLDEARPARWGVLGLLFLSITINLVDRQVLSVLAPVMRDELGLSNTQYAYVLFAFLLGMTLAQVPAGWFLDRHGARLGLPLLMLWWSAANGLHAVGRTAGQFCAFRFLMGTGECGNYSGGIKVISQWFPPRERALAGGIFNSGTVVGAFAAPPLIVALALHFGWRAAFLLPSALGLVWIAPWLAFYRDREPPQPGTPAQPLAPMLRHRQVWGAVLMRMLGGPVVHFYWYWLPEYLKREHHFSLARIGLLAGVPFLFAGLGNLAGGWFSSHLMRRGWSADAARKIAFVLAAALCGASLLMPLAPGELLPIGLISTATFGISAFAANHIALLTDLFSPPVLARLSGLTGVGEGLMNMLLMLATGAVVDHFSYLPVFLAAGLLPALGVAALFLLVRRVELLF